MPIAIKPSHRGQMHADLGVKPGEKLTLAQIYREKDSGDAAKRKRGTFALNARKWNK